MSAVATAVRIPIVHNLTDDAALARIRAIVDASGVTYAADGSLTGYARISLDGDGRGLGVERQVEDILRLATYVGEPLARIVVENDMSGSEYARKPRELWPSVVDGMRSGSSSHVLATSTSRLTRDVGELHELLKLRRVGASFSTTQGVRMHPGMSAWEVKVVRDAGSQDAAESDLISERVTRALLQNATNGTPHGPIAYGWDRERLRDGSLVETINEAQAAVIREAADRILAGQSLRSIARDLDERGVPAPREQGWSLSALKQLMVRERNAARRVHRRVVVGPAAWPAILEPDVHDAVVAVLTDPTRGISRGPSRHLLSGLLTCGKCLGSRLYVNSAGGGSYQCHDCFGIKRVQAPIDAYVVDALLARLAEPDALDFLAVDAGALEAARASLATLRGKLLERTDMFDREEMGREEYARSSARIRAQIATAEAELQAARPVPAAVRELAATETIEEAREAWELLELEARREVVRAMLSIVLLPTNRRGFRTDTIRLDWHTSAPAAA